MSITIKDGAPSVGDCNILSTQTIDYAATIFPDLSLGNVITVGQLIGDITINSMANKVVTIGWWVFSADGTDRVITWNANYLSGNGVVFGTTTVAANTTINVLYVCNASNVTITGIVYNVS